MQPAILSLISRRSDQQVNPIAGLSKVESTNALSETLIDEPALIDGVRFVAALETFWAESGPNDSDSYGVDLQTPTSIAKMNVYTVPFGGTGVSWSTDRTFKVYKSSDNSTWTEVDQYTNPTVIESGTGTSWGFELLFTIPQTARFFKVRNDTNVPRTLSGNFAMYIGEIEVS